MGEGVSSSVSRNREGNGTVHSIFFKYVNNYAPTCIRLTDHTVGDMVLANFTDLHHSYYHNLVIETCICCTLFTGHQRPSLRFLNRYVRGEVGLKWHDLGIELLDSDDTGNLDIIEADHPSDHDKCCVKMFKLWLRKQPTASWNQLVEALRQPDIEFHTLASRIEQMLKPKG